MTEPKKMRPRRPRAEPAPVPELEPAAPVEAVAEVVDAAPEPQDPPAPSAPEPYRTGRWSGFPNYECARCEFRTLDRALIEDHVRTAHPALRR